MKALRLSTGLALLIGCSDARTAPTPAASPANIATISGVQQIGVAGSPLTAPIVVRVTDASNNGVAHVPVEFIVTAGGGSLANAAVVTDATGSASTIWTLGTGAGVAQSVEAHALDPNSGARIATVVVTATARAAAPAHLDIAGGNAQTAIGGSRLTDSLAVKVTDQFGNPVVGSAITWTPDAVSGTVTPTSSITDSAGIARTSWQLGTTPGAQQVVAKSAFGQQTFAAQAGSSAVQVVLSAHDIALRPAATQQLTEQAVDNLGALVTRAAQWQSSDATIATVSASGLVTAIAPGNARIIATVDRAADTARVVVSATPAAPTVTTSAATDVNAAGAVLHAQISTGGATVGPTVWFEYGRDPALAGASVTVSQVVAPSSAPVTIANQISALSPSTQYYFRGVVASAADTIRGTILSFTTTASTGTAVPAALPMSVAAQYDAATGFVHVSWQYSGTDATYYQLRRVESGQTDVTFSTPVNSSQLTFVDNQLSAEQTHTVAYTVQACNGGGCGQITATGNQSISVPRLEPPTALTATVNASGLLTLTWHDNSANEVGFEIYQRAAGGTYGAAIATVPANTTTYSATLPANNTFFYVVRAVLPTGGVALVNRSLPSNEVVGSTVTTGQAAAAVTLNPTQVAATSAGLTGSVTPNGLPTTLYFEFGTDATLAGATQSPVVDAGSGAVPFASSYSAPSLAANTTYYYRIVATNSAGVARGNIVSFRTAAPTLAPTNVQAVFNATRGTVDLTWTAAGETNVGNYSIARIEGGVTTALGTSTADVPAFADFTVDASVDHAFTYSVQACDRAGCGPAATATINVARLDPPTGLTVTVAADGTTTLHWQDNSSGETGFAIFSRPNNGTYARLDVAAANATSYTTSIPVGQTRYFTVRATFPVDPGAGGFQLSLPYSLPSNEVLAATPGSGTAPTVVTTSIQDVSRTSATLHGTVNPNGLPTLAHFEYGVDPTLTTSTSTATLDAGGGTVPFDRGPTVFGLTPNSTYYVRIVATNSAGTTLGNILSFRTGTPLLAVTAFQAAYDPQTGSVNLTWTPTLDAPLTRYDVSRTEGAAQRDLNVTPPASAFVDQTFDVSTPHTFTYTLSECNDIGCGPASAPVTVTAPRLEPPSNLTVTVAADGTTTLNWQDNSSNEATFVIYERSNATTFQITSRLPANSTSFTTTIPVGETRYFAVAAALDFRTTNYGDPVLNQPKSLMSNAVLATTPTPPAPPTALTFNVTGIGRTSAAPQGYVTPNGLPTTLHFEWSTSPTFVGSSSTPNLDAGAGSVAYGAGVPIGSLTPATTYYVRVVGVNSAGTTNGNVLTFTTLP